MLGIDDVREGSAMCCAPSTAAPHPGLFPRFVEIYEVYGTFEDKTNRQIPLVLLTRTGRTQPREAFAGGDRCR